MELYKEILVNILARKELKIEFKNLSIDATKIIELECYKALQKIKDIIRYDSLDDEDYFLRTEKTVCEFESLGSGCGNRRDFG